MQFALGKALEDAGDPAGASPTTATATRSGAGNCPTTPASTAKAPAARRAPVHPRVLRLPPRRHRPHPRATRSSSPACRAQARPCLSRSSAATRGGSHDGVAGSSRSPAICGFGASSLSTTSHHDVVEAMLAEGLPPRFRRRYLARAPAQRRTAAPLFIDKMPNNHARRPQSPDAAERASSCHRRPMAAASPISSSTSALSSYDLADIGAYYTRYIGVDGYFGEICRGAYAWSTRCGSDTEARCAPCWIPRAAVRRTLPALRERARGAYSPSEQVRQPIYREGAWTTGQFDPSSVPLADALGPMSTTTRRPRPPSLPPPSCRQPPFRNLWGPYHAPPHHTQDPATPDRRDAVGRRDHRRAVARWRDGPGTPAQRSRSAPSPSTRQDRDRAEARGEPAGAPISMQVLGAQQLQEPQVRRRGLPAAADAQRRWETAGPGSAR